jgi:putative hydrolase of the HAD superfamily
MPLVLIFDLFGVIVGKQSPEACARIEWAAGAGPALWPVYWGLRGHYDRGAQSGPDYWHAVARKLGTYFAARQIRDLIAADVDSWADVDGDMVSLLAELHGSNMHLGSYGVRRR